MTLFSTVSQQVHFNPVQPLQQWLVQLEIHDRRLARCLAQLIPARCPFERDIPWFGRTIAQITPLGKLNPVWDQSVELRFRALCCLADE